MDEDLIAKFETEQKINAPPPASVPAYIGENNALTTADTYKSQFSDALERAKIEVAKSVTAEGSKTVEKVKGVIADTIVKSTELEQDRVRLEHDKVDLQSDLLTTRKLQEQYIKRQARYEHLCQKRKYHYDGLKAILNRVGINEPTNMLLMYFITLIILPFSLIGMLIKGTIGNALSGLDPVDRAKRVKSFLITFMALIVVAAVVGIILWILKSINVI